MAGSAPKQGPHRRRAGDSARPQLEDTQGFVRMHATSGCGPGGRRNRTRSERVHCEPHSPESAPIRQPGLRNPRTSLARAGRRRAHRHRHPIPSTMSLARTAGAVLCPSQRASTSLLQRRAASSHAHEEHHDDHHHGEFQDTNVYEPEGAPIPSACVENQ